MPRTRFQPVKPRWWEKLGISPRHRYVLAYTAAYGKPPTEAAPIKPPTLTSNIRSLAVTPMMTGDKSFIETEVEITIGVHGLTKLGTLRRGRREIESVLAQAGITIEPRIWRWELTPW